MKSKAPLALMEQMVMLLVFALAAALCMQAFVKSDEISHDSYMKGSAALAAQNAVEAVRHNGGSPRQALSGAAAMLGGSYEDRSGGMDTDMSLHIYYDEEWNVSEEADAYQLTARAVPAEEEGLYRIIVHVFEDGKALAGGTETVQQTGSGAAQEPVLLYELESAWLEVSADE